MVQKIHPWGVILVTNLSLMWADQVKQLTAVPFIYIKKPMYNVNKIIFCNLFCITLSPAQIIILPSNCSL